MSEDAEFFARVGTEHEPPLRNYDRVFCKICDHYMTVVDEGSVTVARTDEKRIVCGTDLPGDADLFLEEYEDRTGIEHISCPLVRRYMIQNYRP